MQRLILAVFVIYNIVLLALAVSTPVGMTVDTPGLDIKLHHLAAMALYAFFVWWLIFDKTKLFNKALPFIATFIFGAFIEVIQSFLPHRSGRLTDLISNTIGILIGYSLIILSEKLLTNFKQKKKEQGSSLNM